jgi:hypothetical protein
MNDNPCNTARIVANMLHDNSLLTDLDEFDPTILLKMFVCVQETRGFDEEFMTELYDNLRVLAQDNKEFEFSLIEAEIMEYQDIWGIQV